VTEKVEKRTNKLDRKLKEVGVGSEVREIVIKRGRS
jgi:hypothetical protein